MYFDIGETMPKKKESGKTEQIPLDVDVLPDDQTHADSPGKKSDRKKITPPLHVLPQTGMIPAEPVQLERLGRFPPVKDFPFSAPIPIIIRPGFEEIGEIIRTVCRDNIDEEYYYLGILLLEKLARKRPSPLLSGKTHVWAAGVLCALGTINFLFDKSTVPYISKEDLADCCGVKQSTASEKSRLIRELFKMSYWDSRFSTRRMHERNPLNNLMITKNGFILNLRSILMR